MKKRLIILILGILIVIIGVIILMFVLDKKKHETNTIIEKKVNDMEEYLLSSNGTSPITHHMLYDIDLNLKRNEKLRITVIMYQNGERRNYETDSNDIFLTSDINACVSYEGEKCITGEKKSILVFKVYDDGDKMTLEFYNPLSGILYPLIELGKSGNFSSFCNYFPFDDIKLKLNKEIVIGWMGFNDQSNDPTDSELEKEDDIIKGYAMVNDIFFVIKAKIVSE